MEIDNQTFLGGFQNFDLQIHGIRLPKFRLSKEDYNILTLPDGLSASDLTSLELFNILVEEGFQKRLKNDINPKEEKAYRERLSYEMGVISPTDFVDYLLMVWDVVNIAKKNKIAVGKGRGSAASSLVLYCLEITDIDPLKYGLFFERFLSEARTTPNIVDGVKYYSDAADVDLDIEDSLRESLINILKEKYEGHFCKVSTFSTFQSKRCIKEVCKIVLGYSEEQTKAVSSMIPSIFNIAIPLAKAVEEVPEFKSFTEKHPEVYKIARKLEGLICSKGSHASAYIVSFDPLLDTLPCEMGEGELVTSYDMEFAQLNNIKLDLLGLKAIGIINEVCKMLNIKRTDFKIDYDNVFQHLQEVKHPYGLFQISGDCNLRVVNKVKPKNIDHLAAVTALARPGALQFVDRYAQFVNEGKNESIHPFFDELLKSTASLALYQESTMQMCEKVGLTKADGEIIRKLIGKKMVKEMKKWKEIIFQTCEKNGLEKEIPELLWEILSASANYSFNKCLGESTIIETDQGFKMMFEIRKGDRVKAFRLENEEDHFVEVLNIHRNKVELFEVELEDGRKIEASLDHKFLCSDKKMRKLKDVIGNNLSVVTDKEYQKVISSKNLGIRPTLDLEVNSVDHNFYAEGVVVSNSHSFSYGYTSAETVYLKYKYPQHFFLACLKIAASRSDFVEEFRAIQQELPYFNIQLLPPHIGKSKLDFEIEGNNIRFGLGEIKGVSEKSIDRLRSFISADKASDFQVFAAAKEAKLNIGILSSLIQSGALGHSVWQRSSKVLEAQVWNLLTPKEKLFCLQNENKYKSDLIALLKDYSNWIDSTGKKFTKATRLETIRKKSSGYFKIYQLNSRNDLLASYFYEKNLLGFSYSTTLKQIFESEVEGLRNIHTIQENVPVKGPYKLIATVSEVMSGKSKNGNTYLKLNLFDETASTPAMLLGDRLAKYLSKFEAPQEGDIVHLEGSKGEDILWINELEVQNHKVYTKLSELNNNDENES